MPATEQGYFATIVVERQAWQSVAMPMLNLKWHGREEVAALGKQIDELSKMPQFDNDVYRADNVPVSITLTENELRLMRHEILTTLNFTVRYAHENGEDPWFWATTERVAGVGRIADELIRGFERDRAEKDGLHRPDGTI